MKPVRIFVSSPGDVGAEREKAREVFDRLQAEYSGVLHLLPYFWEHEPLRAHTDPQAQTAPLADFDVCVCLLWSRLGTRLYPGLHRKADGGDYASGTEYELYHALEAFRRSGAPEVLVYKRQDNPVIPPTPKEERERVISQYDALQDFFEQLTRTDGHIVVGINSYAGLDRFETKFEGDMRKVLIRYVPDGVAGSRSVPKSWTTGSPFRGLQHFDFEHAPVFFGRTRAIDEVLMALKEQAIDQRAFVLVFGGSGVGKSSLVRAGVLPWLVRPGVIDGVGLWRRAIMRPSEVYEGDLFEALAVALMRAEGLPEIGSDGTTSTQLAAMLRQKPDGVGMLVKGALSQAAREVQLLEKLQNQPRALLALAIDQLEELFTVERLADQREGFLRAIDALARSGLIWVLATLRSDFYPRCEESLLLMELKKGAGQYHLQPPDEVQLGQMIRLPASAAGLLFEEDHKTGERLDDLLRDAAVQSPAALPLLEFVLEELYVQRDDEKCLLKLDVFRKLGGVAGALGKRAEESFHDASVEAQKSFDLVFRQLVTIGAGEGEPAVRRRARKGDVEATPGARELLTRFTADRLLVADRAENGVVVIGLAHEALLTAWEQLRNWVERHRESLATRAHVDADADRWLKNSRNADYLYASGLPLEKARKVMEQGFLGAVEEDFVRASIRSVGEKARRKFTRLKIIAGVIAALGIAAGVTAFWAIESGRKANAARGDADELNSYLLGDLRNELEEIGRVDLLDTAAERAAVYLRRLSVDPGDRLRKTQRLQLAHNIAHVRLVQGRLTAAAEILRAAVSGAREPGENDRALTLARARVLNALCDLLARTGNNPEGQQAGREALSLLTPLNDDEALTLRGDTLINLADLQKQLHEYDAASRSLSEATALSDGILARGPSRVARRLRLRALLRQGDLAFAHGDIPAAQSVFEARLRSAEEYRAAEPTAPLWKVEIALSHDRLAQFWLNRLNFDKGATAADEALLLWRDLLAHDPDNLEWRRLEATANTKRAQIYLAVRDAEKARELLVSAVETGQRLVQSSPNNLTWAAGLATAHSLLADAIADLGETANALREAQTALELRRHIYQDPAGRIDIDNTRKLTFSLVKTSGLLMQSGRYAEAEQLVAEAVELARSLTAQATPLPEDRSLLAAVLENHGETLVGQERQPEGAKLYEEAREIRVRLVAAFPPDAGYRLALADCRESLAGLYKDRGNMKAALGEAEAACALRRELARELPARSEFGDAVASCERLLNELATPRPSS